jgi:hypothetical protein
MIFDLGRISGSIEYTITGVAAGSYLVGCIINLDRNQGVSAADIGGYYDGSTDAPISHSMLARPIAVQAESLRGLDFGVGPIECLARHGEPCSQDSDCGGTLCHYPESGRFRGLHEGTCELTSLTCREAPVDCPLLDGEAGTASESDCLGAGPE